MASLALDPATRPKFAEAVQFLSDDMRADRDLHGP